MGAVEDKVRELTKMLDEMQEEAKDLAETMPGLLKSLHEKLREAEIMIKKRRMEYQGGRPGCYKCKQSITSNDDYYTLIWKGKTWSVEVNYHIDCLLKAFEDGDINLTALGVAEVKRS